MVALRSIPGVAGSAGSSILISLWKSGRLWLGSSAIIDDALLNGEPDKESSSNSTAVEKLTRFDRDLHLSPTGIFDRHCSGANEVAKRPG